MEFEPALNEGYMKSILLFLPLICFVIHIPGAFAYDVIFNTKTYVYHTPLCEWARKCTKSCIKTDHALARRGGGVPCKVCGGLEKSGNYKNPNDDSKNKELAEIERLKDEMTKLKARELERVKTILPTFDSDYQTLHGKN
jgi:hypothetical protein